MTVRTAVEKARDPGRALAEAVDAGKVSHSAILKAVGINPTDPAHQAALLAADRYGLDPLLKHIIVISGKGTYITRDGWLHIAHREGQLDGIEVLDQWDTDTHWCAKVAVWRKDMTRPFAYIGRYPHNAQNKQYGPEMAVKTAEVAALRRAFPVAGVSSYEEQWDNTALDTHEQPPPPETQTEHLPLEEPDDA